MKQGAAGSPEKETDVSDVGKVALAVFGRESEVMCRKG